MKPRIVRIDGIWHCGILGVRNVLGLGYTASEALLDWEFNRQLEWMP
jgi:hypothetical protein